MGPDLNRLVKIAKEYSDRHICILTHDFPDADAISASYALQWLLLQDGIRADILYGGRIDRSGTEKMLPTLGIRAEPCDGKFTENDAVIFVDCQAGTGNTTFSGGICLACIDHHPTAQRNKSEYLFRRIEQTGSCATLMAEFCQEKGCPLPTEVATALLLGLKMDTNDFTRGVTQRDIAAFSFLQDKTDQEVLHYIGTSRVILSDLKAYGSAISNMKLVSDLGFSYVPFDCPDGLIAALADFMLDIDEISISVVFSRRDNGVKLSVRSILPFIDAGRFASEALRGVGSGGGHAMFAGGFIPNESIASIPEEELQDRLSALFLREYPNQMKRAVGM